MRVCKSAEAECSPTGREWKDVSRQVAPEADPDNINSIYFKVAVMKKAQNDMEIAKLLVVLYKR